jgi:hypothetical protein
MGWMARVVFPAGESDFSLPHSFQTGSGTHPTSYPMVPGVKWPRREADHSTPASAQVKNGGARPPLPHVFVAWCSITQTQGQLYLCLCKNILYRNYIQIQRRAWTNKPPMETSIGVKLLIHASQNACTNQELTIYTVYSARFRVLWSCHVKLRFMVANMSNTLLRSSAILPFSLARDCKFWSILIYVVPVISCALWTPWTARWHSWIPGAKFKLVYWSFW